MDWNSLGLLAVLLVCPIAMMLMMRGGGHGAHQHGSPPANGDPLAGMSEEQLRELALRAEREVENRRAHERHTHGQ